MAGAFCQRHDAMVWECLCRILHISPEQGDDVVGAAPMLSVLGGIGLRSACRGSTPAFWASWGRHIAGDRWASPPRLQGNWSLSWSTSLKHVSFRPQRWLVVSSLVSWDLNLSVGKQQLRGHDHHSGNLTTSSQALCDLVGNSQCQGGGTMPGGLVHQDA